MTMLVTKLSYGKYKNEGELFAEPISESNVKLMGEMIALQVFRVAMRFDFEVVPKLYNGLIKDLHRMNSPEYIISDGYDYAQIAIEILENAKIIYKCSRFDIKSKASLRGEQKYYLADLGIYFATNVDARINYGPVLENILYTYMKAKNYRVSVGKMGKLECDFIARKDTDYYYAQVAMTIMEKTTEDREYEPYRRIRDNYPKYLFALDTLLQKRDGVIHANMIDFMAQDKEL